MWRQVALLYREIRANRCEDLRARRNEGMALMLLAVAPTSFCQNVGKRNEREETLK
jgi:hypothetical protein